MSRPFVSCITPTYNRVRFLPYLIYQFNYQTYPANLRELIIFDDSPESNEDLVKSLNKDNNIKYIYQKEKLDLGKKRNMLNEMASGDIILAVDDDDFIFAERITHTVMKMTSTKGNIKGNIAGNSLMYVFFLDIQKIYQFGPYNEGHSTNGTLAYRKEYVKNHSYKDDAKMAEEKFFLDDFKGKVIQLDPMKTILCIAHDSNTFDKHTLLKKGPNPFMKETKLKLKDFVKDKKLRDFYNELIIEIQDKNKDDKNKGDKNDNKNNANNS